MTQGQRIPTWWRKFWISVGIVTVAFVALNLGIYFLGYIYLNKLSQYLIWNFAAISIAYTIQHITREVLSKKTQLLLNKIAYTMLGAWIGLLIAFLGVVFIILASRFFNGPDIGHIDGLGLVWIVTIVILMIIGGKWLCVWRKARVQTTRAKVSMMSP